MREAFAERIRDFEEQIRARYAFPEVSHSLSAQDGFCLRIRLTPAQISTYNAKLKRFHQFRRKAEAYEARRTGRDPSQVRELRVETEQDLLCIYGQPQAVNALLFQIFDGGTL